MKTKILTLGLVVFLLVPASRVLGAYTPIQPRGPSVQPATSAAVSEEKPTPSPTKAPKPTLLPEQETASATAPLPNKIITISLKDQSLKYFEGTQKIGEFKISSGLPRTPTPPGEYQVIVKKPLVTYKGVDYYYPNTKWNLMFKRGSAGNYYIHGAFWHDKFGTPASHGCVNVSYANMEFLYGWADTGTRILIQ